VSGRAGLEESDRVRTGKVDTDRLGNRLTEGRITGVVLKIRHKELIACLEGARREERCEGTHAEHPET